MFIDINRRENSNNTQHSVIHYKNDQSYSIINNSSVHLSNKKL